MSQANPVPFHAGPVISKRSGRFAAGLGVVFFGLCSVPTLVALPGGEVTGAHMLMLLSLPVWFAAALSRGATVLDPLGRFMATAIIACCAALIFLAFLSAFNVTSPFRVMRPVVALIGGPALLMLMIGTVTRERLYLYVSVICFAVAITGIMSIIAMAEPSLHARIFRGSDRAAAFFKNPNQLGIVLSTLLPVTLAMALGAERRRLLWLSAFAVMLVALMLSGSKANILISALTVPVALLFFVFVRYSGAARIVMTCMAVFGALLAGSLLISALASLNPRALRLLEQATGGEATHSLLSRGTLWDESIALFLENPVLGVGAGQPIGYPHSHNLVIDFARTLGMPGLTFIVLIILSALIACTALIVLAIQSRVRPIQDRFLCIGLALGPVAYLLSNMSSDSLGPTTSPYFFATLMMGLVARSLLSKPDQATTHRYRLVLPRFRLSVRPNPGPVHRRY